MKYSKDEAFNEIMNRGKRIKKQHDKRNTVILSSVTALSAFLLIISVSLFAGGGEAGTYSTYGSFVLKNDSIQYVVEALATFLFGSIVTIAIHKIRNFGNTKR